MNFDEILFSPEHIWVKKDKDSVLLGLSDYAQKKLKAIMFVNLPEEGDVLEIGEKFGDVESIKTVSDLISPISGKVIEINESAVDEPDMINEAPYESWLIRVSADELSDRLMDCKAYEEYKEKA